MRALLVVLLLVLAGCVDDRPDDDGTERPIVTTGPMWVTWYFDADGVLVDDLPGAGSTTLEWSLGQWLDGTLAPAWTRSNPEGLHILAGNITLWYEAALPTSGADARPEFTAWWGSSHSVQHHVFIDGPDALTAGQVVEATSALRIPVGGLTVPPGTDHMTRVGSYYLDGPGIGSMRFLTGDGAPSRLDLFVQPATWPTGGSEEALIDATFDLRGGRCAAPLSVEGSADWIGTFGVSPDVDAIIAGLTLGEGGPTPDIDFAITGPDGQDVGGGHGSGAVEGAHVGRPTLEAVGPGTYTVHVYNCTPQVRTIGLQVTALRG